MQFNPAGTFFRSLNTMRDFRRGVNADKQQDQLFDMRMNAYKRAERKDREADQVAAEKRSAASTLARLDGGTYTTEDVAKLDPAAHVSFDEAFDEQKQDEVMRQLWPWFDRVAKGDIVPEEVKPKMWEAGGALRAVGILPQTVGELKEQAQIAPALKNSIVGLSEQMGGKLLGQRTRISEDLDPELFARFSRVFPAVSGSSQVFKDGQGRPVEFLIDGTGVDKIQDARVVVLLEGVNPETGERYRAPMSNRRSNDPNDVVSTARIGDLYAQTDFAERASKAVLASLAGMDDATAQKVLDRYWENAERLREEQRKRLEGTKQAGALSDLVGFNADEKKKLEAVAEAGGNIKNAAELLIKKRKGADRELVWRDNVDIGGKPYHVAFDKKSGKKVAQVPQWVKAGKAGGASGGGGGSGTMGEDEFRQWTTKLDGLYKSRASVEKGFDPLTGEVLDQSNIEKALKTLDGQIANTERYISRKDPEQWYTYSGKHVQVESGHARGGQAEPSVGGGDETFAVVPATEEGAAQLENYLASIKDEAARAEAVKQVAGENPELFRLLEQRAQGKREQSGGMQSQAGSSERAGGGMAAPAFSVPKQPRMIGGKPVSDADYNAAVNETGAKILGVPYQFVMSGLNQIADYFVVNPAQALKSDIGQVFKAFQDWAKSRYGTAGAEKKPEALQEYAQVNPQGADAIKNEIVKSQQ